MISVLQRVLLVNIVIYGSCVILSIVLRKTVGSRINFIFALKLLFGRSIAFLRPWRFNRFSNFYRRSPRWSPSSDIKVQFGLSQILWLSRLIRLLWRSWARSWLVPFPHENFARPYILLLEVDIVFMRSRPDQRVTPFKCVMVVRLKPAISSHRPSHLLLKGSFGGDIHQRSPFNCMVDFILIWWRSLIPWHSKLTGSAHFIIVFWIWINNWSL